MNWKLVWHLPPTRKTAFCRDAFSIPPENIDPLFLFFQKKKRKRQIIWRRCAGLCFILLHHLPLGLKYKYLVDLCCGRQPGRQEGWKHLWPFPQIFQDDRPPVCLYYWSSYVRFIVRLKIYFVQLTQSSTFWSDWEWMQCCYCIQTIVP